MEAFIGAFLVLAALLCVTSLIMVIIDMIRESRVAKGEDSLKKSTEQRVEKPTAPPKPTLAGRTPSTSAQKAKWTGDSFVDSLTAEEQSVFLQLFLQERFDGVPAYRLRADNTQFFKKIMIYYGTFRGQVPNGLTQKIRRRAESYLTV